MSKSAKLKREKVFLDPVHDDILVQSSIILDLINTPEMQRLRRIKQLGTTTFTFHGAEHNRFGHCLGVYELTRAICDRFQRNYPTQQAGDGGWDDDNRLLALCAALLHDIGHGPFSHTFEQLFQTDHEAITQNIILDPSTQVNAILSQVSPQFPNEVAAVISHEHPNQQVVQMISSQLDADRMDYLLRDSYYTGTHYGRFDKSRILRVMQPAPEGIIYHYAGMHAVEDYLVSRYQMYMQVYFHPVTRGMEMILKALLHRASDLYPSAPAFFERTAPLLVPFLTKNWELNDYLALDDAILETYFNHWLLLSDDPILCDLCRRFINRVPFKSVSYNSETDGPLIDILQHLIQDLQYDLRYYFAKASNYDLPYDLYRPDAKNPRTQIELLQKNGERIELSQASSLIQAFTGQFMGDERLYFPNELYFGKNKEHVSLFEPTLKAFHHMTKTGVLQALPKHGDLEHSPN